jgi:integrase/recombinase XerD
MLDRMRAWTDYLEATDHRPKTIRAYRYWILRFAADTLIDPWDATEDDLVSYLADQPKNGSSRSCVLRAFKSYWSWAAPRAGRDPTDRLHIRRPPSPKAPHIPPQVFREILREAFRREPRRGWTLLLLFSTGIRIGSLVAIRPADIDLEQARLHVREAKGGRSYELPLVRLSATAARWLLSDSVDRETLVGVGQEQVRNWLREARLSAGVPDRVWPHLLRHSFATELARVTDPETWRVAMNHADLSNFPRYVHTDSERIRAAVAQIRL